MSPTKVKSLCCSGRPIGFIKEKRRLVSGAFAWYFIPSTQLKLFFDTFALTILSDLKHFRLCDLVNFSKNSSDKRACEHHLSDHLSDQTIV